MIACYYFLFVVVYHNFLQNAMRTHNLFQFIFIFEKIGNVYRITLES